MNWGSWIIFYAVARELLSARFVMKYRCRLVDIVMVPVNIISRNILKVLVSTAAILKVSGVCSSVAYIFGVICLVQS